MRRRAGARRQSFSPKSFFVRLSVSTQIPAGESTSLTQQKSPARYLGAFWLRFFSRKALASAAREGSLAFGSFSRLQWRDRGRFSRPSPLPLPANWKLSVCRGSGSVNVRHKRLYRASSAVLPVWFALFDQRTEPFLRILEAVQLVEENIHGVLHAIAQRKPHPAENSLLGHGQHGT